MESVCRFITERLKLKVNEAKRAVDFPQNRTFLGFSFTAGRLPHRRKMAPELRAVETRAGLPATQSRADVLRC
jgi:RNA-directed DNA polymerase